MKSPSEAGDGFAPLTPTDVPEDLRHLTIPEAVEAMLVRERDAYVRAVVRWKVMRTRLGRCWVDECERAVVPGARRCFAHLRAAKRATLEADA